MLYSSLSCSILLFCSFFLFFFFFFFFFFNDTATTEIYTLSLHDALPISEIFRECGDAVAFFDAEFGGVKERDRKSTRLNSSHTVISYAVFCLKKKKKKKKIEQRLKRDYNLVLYTVDGNQH